VNIVILALQSNTFGGGSVAVAQMAQPNPEPVEEFEYVPQPFFPIYFVNL
jgi:hypothetical protein